VVRGLHYQVRPQGKLVEILDVVVGSRRRSPTFGRWDTHPFGTKQMLWVPPGSAHGFHVRSENIYAFYEATDFYDPESERTIAVRSHGRLIGN